MKSKQTSKTRKVSNGFIVGSRQISDSFEFPPDKVFGAPEQISASRIQCNPKHAASLELLNERDSKASNQ